VVAWSEGGHFMPILGVLEEEVLYFSRNLSQAERGRKKERKI
jgi:hypothetical protein